MRLYNWVRFWNSWIYWIGSHEKQHRPWLIWERANRKEKGTWTLIMSSIHATLLSGYRGMEGQRLKPDCSLTGYVVRWRLYGVWFRVKVGIQCGGGSSEGREVAAAAAAGGSVEAAWGEQSVGSVIRVGNRI